MADAYWGEKVAKGQVETIRPCLGCHEGCLNRKRTGSIMSCSVNPATGRESSAPILPANKPKNIMIVGGGVAGLECARVAKLRNHNVTVFEKSEKLGGHLIEASVPDFKADIGRLLDWYEREMRDLEIQVELGTAVNAKLVDSLTPEVVVIATGSVPLTPDIPGIEKPFVVTCCDLLLGKKKAGNQVMVIGGGLEGSETALWLASQGKNVTIVEMLSDIATGTSNANRHMLLKLLADNDVRVVTEAKLHEVKDGKIVVLTSDMEAKEFQCDTVALSIGMKSNRDLYDSLVGQVGELYAIGDCNQPRKIHDAIWEGWNLGRTL